MATFVYENYLNASQRVDKVEDVDEVLGALSNKGIVDFFDQVLDRLSRRSSDRIIYCWIPKTQIFQ